MRIFPSAALCFGFVLAVNCLANDLDELLVNSPFVSSESPTGASRLPAVESYVAGEEINRGLNYILAPGDILTLRVFQEDDMESQQRISQDGSVFFPLIGKTRLADLSLGEATRRVTALLKEKYFVNPQVSLSIDRYAPRRFSVLGQVTEPNTYTIPDEEVVSLPMAIAMAGGQTRLANPKAILVSRKQDGKTTTYKLDLRNAESRDFIVLPGDIITVPERIF